MRALLPRVRTPSLPVDSEPQKGPLRLSEICRAPVHERQMLREKSQPGGAQTWHILLHRMREPRQRSITGFQEASLSCDRLRSDLLTGA